MITHCPYCQYDVSVSTQATCPRCGNPINSQPVNPTLHHPAVPQPFEGVDANQVMNSAVVAARSREYGRRIQAMTPVVWVTPLIVVLNAAMFLFLLNRGAEFMGGGLIQVYKDWGANYGPLTLSGEWWRLASCMFLHFGIMHVGMNMYVLWSAGNIVERLVGNMGYIVLYSVTGLCASMTSLFWNQEIVSAGASGAVFGVCGGLLGFVIPKRNALPPELVSGLKRNMMNFVLFNVIIYFAIPGIDMAAHAGGFIAGIGCGIILSRSLDKDKNSWNWMRPVTVVILAAVILPTSTRFLPDPPPDFYAVHSSFKAAWEKADAATKSLDKRMQSKTISFDAAASEIDTVVIPAWEEAIMHRKTMMKSRFDDQEAALQDLENLENYIEHLKTQSKSFRSIGIEQRRAV